jgi:hypothetical protein
MFLRRASDGGGRSIISSMLVMFGVKHDKKIWIYGDLDGFLEMATSGSRNFCMSETDSS